MQYPGEATEVLSVSTDGLTSGADLHSPVRFHHNGRARGFQCDSAHSGVLHLSTVVGLL